MKSRTIIWSCTALAGTAFAAAAVLSACAENGDAYYKPIAKSDYPAADGPGESLAPGEIESAARIAAIIEAHLRRIYKAEPIRRDAHPKAHGCVEANFAVRSDLPDALRKGIFATAGAYRAIVRFSNGNEDPSRADDQPDSRGMAVKLLDPPGQPLTVDPRGAPSQDFIMINYPKFLVGDPDDYRKLISFLDADTKPTTALQPVLALWSIGIKGAISAASASSSHIDNPLNTRYWSMVPYQLGNGPEAKAVKYSAAPCEAKPVVLPDGTPDPNYLRHALAATLAPGGQGACMKFMVQPRTSDAMNVEDSRDEWPEDKAPFIEAATLTFAGQTFDTPEQNAACEALSYSPWHALPEDKPLGAVNRMRKAIYERISAVRRATEAETGETK